MWKLLSCRSHHHHYPRPFLTTRFSVLARDRRFEELADLLAPSRLQKYGGGGMMDVPLPLHYLLRYQPPLSIVNRLLQLHDWTKPEHVDSFGRNALHVACYYNADVTILARLVNYEHAGRRCLNVPDILTGRYPLHFLCDRYDQSLAASALFLRDVLPMASAHHDVYGHTPADILQHQQSLHHSPTRDFSLLPPPPLPSASAAANHSPTKQQLAAQEKTTALQKKKNQKKATKDSAAATPSTLHIPYDFVTTVSDLTEATAFLLMNLIDPPPSPPHHHHNNNKAANVSLHSKSTCSTTTTTDSAAAAANQQQHGKPHQRQQQRQQQQQMMIVNAVRKQLSKHPVVPHQRTNKTTKRSTKSTIDEESSSAEDDDDEMEEEEEKAADGPDDEYDREDATAPLLPYQKYQMTLPPRRYVTATAAAEDWESVRC
jgi:hypothetical protein